MYRVREVPPAEHDRRVADDAQHDQEHRHGLHSGGSGTGFYSGITTTNFIISASLSHLLLVQFYLLDQFHVV